MSYIKATRIKSDNKVEVPSKNSPKEVEVEDEDEKKSMENISNKSISNNEKDKNKIISDPNKSASSMSVDDNNEKDIVDNKASDNKNENYNNENKPADEEMKDYESLSIDEDDKKLINKKFNVDDSKKDQQQTCSWVTAGHLDRRIAHQHKYCLFTRDSGTLLTTANSLCCRYIP